jgi:hypothetical protein
LKRLETSTVESFPRGVSFDPNKLEDPAFDIDDFTSQLILHLEHLQNTFFIERLLNKSGQANHADLMAVSFELVTTTLIFYKHQDRFIPNRGNFEWLVCSQAILGSEPILTIDQQVMSYAAPASGVLCMELLQPSLLSTPSPVHINRSTIVQNLSLLAAFLDWVGPSAPNGGLCSNVKSILTRVLDQSLNPGILQGPPAAAWDIDFEVDELGLSNFELLDTFNWLHSDFPTERDPTAA